MCMCSATERNQVRRFFAESAASAYPVVSVSLWMLPISRTLIVYVGVGVREREREREREMRRYEFM